MQKKHWLQAALGLVVIPALTILTHAKDPALPTARTGGFQLRIEKAVGLTPEQKEAVRGMLAQQREELRTLRESYNPKFAAIQEQTDSKIRSLLSPEQQKKFDMFLAKQKQARSSRRKAS